MTENTQPSEVLAVKDGATEQPVPTAWRTALGEIVKAFVAGDFALTTGVSGVAPLSREKAGHIRSYVEDYGATLVALPELTWSSSVCMWQGDHWDVLVDLWSLEEGRSDLVLHAQVIEDAGSFRVEVGLVYVP